MTQPGVCAVYAFSAVPLRSRPSAIPLTRHNRSGWDRRRALRPESEPVKRAAGFTGEWTEEHTSSAKAGQRDLGRLASAARLLGALENVYAQARPRRCQHGREAIRAEADDRRVREITAG